MGNSNRYTEYVVDLPAVVTLRVRAENGARLQEALDAWHLVYVTTCADYMDLDDDGDVRLGPCLTLYTRACRLRGLRPLPYILEDGVVTS
jgi:hypothetical protein